MSAPPTCTCGEALRLGDPRCPACGAPTPWAGRVPWKDGGPDGASPEPPASGPPQKDMIGRVLDTATKGVAIGAVIGGVLGAAGVLGTRTATDLPMLQQPWFTGALWGAAAGLMLGVQRGFRQLDR